MRRSISGRKVQTLNDRKNRISKQPDLRLLQYAKRLLETSPKLPEKFGTTDNKENYMDLK